jgi:hypothetical protein
MFAKARLANLTIPELEPWRAAVLKDDNPPLSFTTGDSKLHNSFLGHLSEMPITSAGSTTSHPLFLLPIPILRTVFRNKFLDGLRKLYRKGLLDCRGPAAAFGDPAWFEELAAKLATEKWFVHAKPPFGGPAHVLRYLGRYTHRMAISNHRLLAFDGESASASAGAIMPTAASSAS